MKSLNTIDRHRVQDLFPQFELKDIHPISERIFSLVCRNKTKSILKKHFIEVIGAVEMVRGLDYHFSNFTKYKQKIAENENVSLRPLSHEAIAYVNRLGQFYYFYKSDLCSDWHSKYQKALFIEVTNKFRMKHSAHQSIDCPRNESLEDKLGQALAFSGVSLGGKGQNCIGYSHKEKWSKMKIIFLSNQLNSEDSLRLTLEDDHERIMREIFSLFEDILS